MSKLDDIRNDVGTRSKSLLVAVADILESMTSQNLAIANDVAGFAVAQLRLPTQADDFSDYRDRNKDAYSQFGATLKDHGKKLLDVARDVPGQIKDALSTDSTPEMPAVPARKAAAKKPAAKKAPAKKAPAKKTAAKAKTQSKKAQAAPAAAA